MRFNPPTPYGMDATWEGRAMQCQWTDLSGRTGNRDSYTDPLLACDPAQSNYWEPMNLMVSEVNYERLMDYFRSLPHLWTTEIHTVYIYVDKARCSYLGPFRERTTAIHVPICEVTGLHRVHFTRAGTSVLESLVFLFPDKHFVLIDTDCAPASLFEIEERARLMWQREDDVDMVDEEAKPVAACSFLNAFCLNSRQPSRVRFKSCTQIHKADNGRRVLHRTANFCGVNSACGHLRACFLVTSCCLDRAYWLSQYLRCLLCISTRQYLWVATLRQSLSVPNC